ncbi:molybdopterin cofactor-binding domain-containing protein [Flammeovirgaceae bacterium SG7u.111]|nr:molybdopterin cofactor-binding domain-containing protein [Flammeovirgaceae bacterium SG7u.132]WPO36718.1 molybdopterin cofactor-binding domain-containing protein [Flammeovirgaceae bacterium SG7u.111]
MAYIKNISRRHFVASLGLVGGGLLLGCDPTTYSSEASDEPLTYFDPNLFVQLSSDGKVTIVASRSEMGQGVRTSLTATIADEMDADWDLVSVKQAPGDKSYGNQNTDGSRSIRTRFMPMRKMGASARFMLIAAAAKMWKVDASECHTEKHHVIHSSGKKVFYGDLADKGMVLDVPEDVKLKDPSEFNYIGKGLKSIDIHDFVSGKATYGIDVRVPEMKVAAIARCPVTFGSVKSFDKTAALQVTGVEQVIEIPRVETPMGALGGIAVIATNTWAAEKGKAALVIEWDEGENKGFTSTEYLEEIYTNIKNTAKVNNEKGDVEQAFKSADQVLERKFTTHLLAHAPMEVPNAVAWVKEDGSCEIWAPSQAPQGARSEVANFLGIGEEKVTVNVTLLGGGFGRKAKHDFVVEAAAVSKAIKAPVQVVWSREDDIQHSYYHSCSAQFLKASLDKAGKVTGWLHQTAFPSIASTFSPGEKYGAKWEVGQGAGNIRYEIENTKSENGAAPAPVRIGWMRSVHHTNHTFASNIFADEIAHKLGKDPLAHRLELIGSDRVENAKNPYAYNSKRLKNVLEIAAKNAQWGRELPQGHGMGLAVEYCFNSYVASVVEVAVADGKVKVVKAFMAIDCGLVVNPDTVKAQMEGSAVFGTSIALHGKLTAKDGAIEQSNFHDYKVARTNEAPEVQVEIVESQAPPGGVGEPGSPITAPAIFNAVFDATNKRFYSFPLSDHSLV